jgi:hypothetical protein
MGKASIAIGALTDLGKDALSLGRELFGFAIKGNSKVADIAKVNGVTMDTLASASDDTLNAILDRAYKSEAMDKRFAQNISKQIKRDALGALPGPDAPQLKIDNPGGSWLENKLKYAEEDRVGARPNTYRANLGSSEGVTGYFRKPLQLDPNMLAEIKGSAGEELYRPDKSKMNALRESITTKGYEESPILVHVREDGVPFVVEGNHRIIEGIESGRKTIPVEVKYLRGAEEVDGILSPSSLGVPK